MPQSFGQKVLQYSIRLLLIFLANLAVLVDVLRQVIRFGKEYCESAEWYPLPKFLTDPKFGVHKMAYFKDINIHYVESGDPGKPLMLFVHGFPEFWYSWHHQILEFQKDYRVVALDMRGYGLSDKPQAVAQYKIDLMVDDLKQLMGHLGVDRCSLVGHDWGAGIVFAFAQTHPEMLDRLVVLNGVHSSAFRDVLQSSWKQMACSWYMFFFQMPYFPEWYISRMNYKMVDGMFTTPPMGLKRGSVTQDEIRAFKANMSQPGMLTAGINYYRAAFRFPRQSQDVDVPTLLVWGTEDAALTIELPEAHKKYCSNLTIKYLDGGSHWIQQDMPEEVNAAIRDFVSQ